MSEAIDELAELTADLRAHLEWGSMLGADVLPRERVERRPPLRAAPQRSGIGRRRAIERGRAQSKPAPVEPTSAPPAAPQSTSAPAAMTTDTETSDARTPTAAASLSSKWEKVLRAPSTHSSVGPATAALVIVRGAGSSPEAETMLTNMIERVIALSRADVRIIDIVRDGRSAEVVGRGILGELRSTQPQAVLVLGVHAARALLGAESDVGEARGAWHTLTWDGGSAPMRVTHHPEAIRALSARGNTDARRDAFEDLKAVRARLS